MKCTHETKGEAHGEEDLSEKVWRTLLCFVLHDTVVRRPQGVETVKDIRQTEQRSERTGDAEDETSDNVYYPVRAVVWSQAHHEQANRRQDTWNDEKVELVFCLGNTPVSLSLVQTVSVRYEASNDRAEVSRLRFVRDTANLPWYSGNQGRNESQANTLGVEVVRGLGKDAGSKRVDD